MAGGFEKLIAFDGQKSEAHGRYSQGESDAMESIAELQTSTPASRLGRIESDFIQRVLRPYSAKNCIYLRDLVAADRIGAEALKVGDVTSLDAIGTFSIAQSCYIDDTGHFNAVELNICYNQIMYVFVAQCTKAGMVPGLSSWGEREFLKHQLGEMLIIRSASSFRKPISARKFYCRLSVSKAMFKRQTVFLKTRAAFFDDNDGFAESKVDFAILKKD